MADGAVRKLTAVFGANTSGFKKGTNEIKAELTELNTAMYKNKKAQKEVDAELKNLEKQEKELKKAINSVNQPTQEMIREYENLKKKTDELTLKKSKLKSEEQELRIKIKNTNKELDESVTSSTKAGASFEKMGSLLKRAGTLAATGMIGLFTYAQKMASAADDINALAKQTGLTTAEIQKFQYASELIDVDIDVLTGSMAKLIKSMNAAKKGTGTAYETFQALGISILDSSGNLRNNQEVFNEAISALSKIEEGTQRDAYAMAILGKSAQELNPLILGGTQQLKEFGDELERNGLILSQTELDKLNEFNDKIDTFKAKFQANLMKNSGELTEAFDELLDSSDEIIELIATIIKGSAEIAGFIIDHKEAVLALAGTYVTLKASMSIGNLIKSVVVEIKSYTAATAAATTANNSFSASLGKIGLAITALIAIFEGAKSFLSWGVDELDKATGASEFLSKLPTTNKELLNSTKSLNEEIENAIKASKAEADALIARGEEYEKLRKKVNRTAEEEANLYSIASELQRAYPNQISLIDNQTGAYKELGKQAEVTAEQLMSSAEKQARANALVEAYTKKYQIEAEIKTAEQKVTDIYKSPEGAILSDDVIANALNDLADLRTELENIDSLISDLTAGGVTVADAEYTVNTLEELAEKYYLLEDAQYEFNKEQEISQETLQRIIQKYPSLQAVVNDYVDGLISGKVVLEKLSSLYEIDSDNYSKAIIVKNKNTTEFYNALIKNSNTYINELAKQYGIDLTNYKNLNDAKLAIQKEFLSANAKNWEKYYNAEKDSFTISDRDLMQYKKELMQAGYSSAAANSMVNVYKMERQQAIQAVNAWKAISSKLDSSLNNLSGLYKPTFSNSTNISGGSGGSGGSNGSSGSTVAGNTDSVYDKALAAYKKLVDDRIELIKKWTDAEKAAADERIAAIDAEIEARKKLKEDADINKQINAVKAQLKYSKLDNFSRMELERELSSLEKEREETLWLRAKESQKQAVKTESDNKIKEWDDLSEKIRNNEKNATEIFTDLENGYKSTQTIVNNNSTTANIKIVTQGLTAGQVEQKIKDKLGMELIT